MVTRDDRQAFGAMIRAARLDAGLSQEELGARVRRSQRWVSNIEHGEVGLPRRIEVVQLLADALHMSLEDLLVAASLAQTRARAREVAEEARRVPPDSPEAHLISLIRKIDWNEELAATIEGNLRLIIDAQRGRR